MIYKESKYKLQGDGRDSWEIYEYEVADDYSSGYLYTSYMVYTDPNILPIPNVDVVALLRSMTSEQIKEIKQILTL